MTLPTSSSSSAERNNRSHARGSLRRGALLGGGIDSLGDDTAAWLRDQGMNFVVVTCPEDEARWEAERLAAFMRQVAHVGLEGYLAPGGYGKVLDADPAVASLYLHTHRDTLQIDSRGRRCAKACPNDPRFLEWFAHSMRTLAWLLEAKGFVWDGPGFYYGRGTWACRCTYCQRLFSASAGTSLPRELTPEVLEFRRQSLNMFLLAAAAAVESVDRRLESVVVPPAPLDSNTATTGADDWRILAANSGTDTLGMVVSPERPGTGLPPAEALQSYVSAARAEGKNLWLWLMAEQLTPDLASEATQMARSLDLEAIVWSDFDQLVRRGHR